MSIPIFQIKAKKKFHEIVKLTSEVLISVNSLETSIAEIQSLIDIPFQKIIESWEYADDSINKKIITHLFQCLRIQFPKHDLFSKDLKSNVNITFIKKLDQSSIQNLIDESLEDKFALTEKNA